MAPGPFALAQQNSALISSSSSSNSNKGCELSVLHQGGSKGQITHKLLLESDTQESKGGRETEVQAWITRPTNRSLGHCSGA